MSARRFVLALDQGTTGSTALVIDPEGGVRARGYAELPQHYPQPGWVEHDPAQIWATTVQALGQAVTAAGITPAEIAAVGITNQRETTILWERASGRPVGNAIVWQCRRTAALCERLKADGAEPEIRRKTGLVVDAYFSGTKIRWMLDHDPALRPRAERGELCFGTVDAWLLWQLTGGDGARDRSVERLAHPLLRHPPPRVGRRAVPHPRRADGALARGEALGGRVRGDRCLARRSRRRAERI